MPREFTTRALLLGTLLGLVFAIGNTYLGLKVGLTLSASIPTAVIGLALLKLMRGGTLAENNMIQTVASSCDAIATGSILTLPAIAILGGELTYPLALTVGFLGGLLGIALMVPLRHPLMVEESDRLPYPEGTACAEILRSKHETGPKAMLALWGVVIGETYKVLSSLLHLFKNTINIRVVRATVVSFNTTPSLLGIGAIIGVRLSLLIFAGGVLTWWALIPLISVFEVEDLPQLPQLRETVSVTAASLWANVLRFVGVGALAVGGLCHIGRLLPRLLRSLTGHLQGFFRDAFRAHGAAREQHDLPLFWAVVIVALVLVVGTSLDLSPLILLALIFVPLTAASAGLLGISVSPLPGLLLCAILTVGMIYFASGWVAVPDLFLALKLSAVLGIAMAVAAETSQSLKTGTLVGATPYKQQGAMLLALIPAVPIVAATLLILGETYGLGTKELPAPHASLYAIVLDGIFEANMPLNLVAIGGVFAFAVELLGAPSLPFALGIFLPFSTSTAIGVGGALSWVLGDRGQRSLLMGAGLVAGDAISGVIIALLGIIGWINPEAPPFFGIWATVTAYVIVVALFAWLVRRAVHD
jgi:putative OPT family oligopeptide transporter